MSSPTDSLPPTLDPLVAAVAAGSGAAAVLTAPPGAGKSVLLERLERRARHAGWQTGHSAVGPAARFVPYAAVRPLFANPPALLDAPTASVAEAAHHLFRLCSAQAASRPLALFVDNGQWADRASLRVLTQLARRTVQLPLLVIIATRPRQDHGAPDVSAIFSAIAGVHAVIGARAAA